MLSIRRCVCVAVAALALSASSAAPASAAGCPGERSKNRASAAAAIVCLLNQERTRRGIPPVALDPRLSRVARRHAQHMVRYSFTGHVSPLAGGLVTRVKRAGAVSRNRRFWVGENLGWGGSALRVHNAWMRSAIHKKATLYRQFTRVGVGVVRGLPRGSKRRGLTYVLTFAG